MEDLSQERERRASAVTVSQYVAPAGAVASNRFDRRTPLQQVRFREPDQWEQFTCERVRMRAPAEGYLGTEIIGGSNDRGADVVAFFTERRLNGEWHCFQCKLYQDELEPAHALPEMARPFVEDEAHPAPEVSDSFYRHFLHTPGQTIIVENTPPPPDVVERAHVVMFRRTGGGRHGFFPARPGLA